MPVIHQRIHIREALVHIPYRTHRAARVNEDVVQDQRYPDTLGLAGG